MTDSKRSDKAKAILANRAKANASYQKHEADLNTKDAAVQIETTIKKSAAVARTKDEVRNILKDMIKGRKSSDHLVAKMLDVLSEFSALERKEKEQLGVLDKKRRAILADKVAAESEAGKQELAGILESIEELKAETLEEFNRELKKAERNRATEAKALELNDKLAKSSIGKILAKETMRGRIESRKAREKEFLESKRETLRSIENKLQVSKVSGDKYLERLLVAQQEHAAKNNTVAFEHLQAKIDERLEASDMAIQRAFQDAEKAAAHRGYFAKKLDKAKDDFHASTIGRLKELVAKPNIGGYSLITAIENSRARKQIELEDALKSSDTIARAENEGVHLTDSGGRLTAAAQSLASTGQDELDSMREAQEARDTNKELAGINIALTSLARGGGLNGGDSSGGGAGGGAGGALGAAAAAIAAGVGGLVSAAKGLYDVVRGKRSSRGGIDVPTTVGDSDGKGKGKRGNRLAKGAKGGVIGLVVGVAADYALEELKEDQEAKGNKQNVAGIDIGQSAVTGAAIGATVGSFVPVIGTAIGAAVGGLAGAAKGLYDNYDAVTTPDGSDPTAPVVIPPERIAKLRADKAKKAAMANAVSSATGGGGAGRGRVNPPNVVGSDGDSSGPSSGNADLMSVVAVAPNVNLQGLTGQTYDRLTSLANDYYDATGKKLNINSGVRSYEKQAQLYSDYKAGKTGANPANPPGTSLHEIGMALDATPAQVDEMDSLGLLSKHGFERIAGSREKQHIQLAGAQTAIRNGNSGMVSGDAVGAPKISVPSSGSTVTATSSAEQGVVNNKISVQSQGNYDNDEQSVIQGPSYSGAGGGGGRGSGGSGGREAISVASVPTFMFSDPAFYAMNVQAMA